MKHQWMALTTRIEAADKGKAPAWVRLFAAGWGALADGVKFLVDQEAFNAVQAYVAGRGNDLVFDYEHQSLKDIEAPAAGWVKELKWDGDQGIMARVEWTSRGDAYVSGKEYRYFSPVFFIRKRDDRVVGLHSVALTNTPKTNNLTPILAKLGPAETIIHEEITTMDRDQLIQALGLPEDATDSDIMEALAALGIKFPEPEPQIVEKETVAKDVVAALDLETGVSTSTVVATIHALKQGANNSVSREEFDRLQKQITDRRAADAVTDAMAKGKVTPAQKEWATTYAQKDLDGFNMFVAKAPQTIPLEKLPGHTPKAKDDPSVDEATRQVASMMGLSDEDLKKYGEVTNG